MNFEIRLCIAGLKGAEFLKALIQAQVPIHSIASYSQPDDRSNGYQIINELAARIGLLVKTTKSPDLGVNGLTFVVGWQYLFLACPPHVIVFHDSLLPRYRGFAPTVTAMLNGDSVVGVTALQLAADADAGPIVAQRTIPIIYPIKILQVLTLQAQAMAELALEIIHMAQTVGICGTAQDEKLATYSIWRDQADYQIDWSKSSHEIARLVDAVGFPYDGASTRVNDLEIVVEDVTVLEDLHFERRDVGKIWRLDAHRPVVVCGVGLLRIDCFRPKDEKLFSIRNRMRFS